MYKIILVDDDQFTLDNLIAAVDWEKNGFEICGKFLSAEDALLYMKDNNVNAVISDIKMIGMSGIEFAKQVAKDYPLTVFTILSGYESFEYARDALRNNVVDYILKPVTISEIERVLKNMAGVLENRIVKVQPSNSNIELQEFITRYIEKKTDDVSVLKSIFVKNGIKNDACSVPVVFIKVSFNDNMKDFIARNHWYGRDNLNNAIGNLFMNEGALAIPIRFYFASMDYVVFFDCRGIEDCRARLQSVSKSVVGNAKDVLKLNISITQKRIAKNVFDVFDDVRSEFICLTANAIYEYIDAGDAEGADKEYKNFLDKIKNNYDDIMEFYKDISKRISEGKNYIYYSTELKRMADLKTGELMAENTDTVKKLIVTAAEENAGLNAYDYTSMVRAYIENNYDKDISLSDIAEHIRISESWCSRQFKKETGKGIVEYLNDIRIDRATELLKNTDYATKEICTAVGYKSQNHFCTMFKKHTGYSPQEYRKMLKSDRKI